jgi:hypothetical protein
MGACGYLISIDGLLGFLLHRAVRCALAINPALATVNSDFTGKGELWVRK